MPTLPLAATLLLTNEVKSAFVSNNLSVFALVFSQKLPFPAKVTPVQFLCPPILCRSNSPPMTSPQLPNHLLSNRKRLALSQGEVAFLLGTESGAQVCRYEQFDRQPSLETALACEVI